MRIALLQMTSGIDVQSNAASLVGAVKAAAEGGASVLFTPEMSGLLDRDRTRAAAHIVSEVDDPVLKDVCAAAHERGIAIHLGSLALKGEGAKYVNRGFLIDDQGEIRARYDKLHMFDVDLPTGESWRESSAYQAGSGAAVVELGDCKLGLSICYDLRFPALYGALSDAGASLLSVPAAFTVPTGQAHWHTLLKARAIENACWLVAAAQTGLHADGRTTYGHSLVIDPWGEIVVDMGDEPGIAFADIDPDLVMEVRRRIPVLAHRRAIPKVAVS